MMSKIMSWRYNRHDVILSEISNMVLGRLCYKNIVTSIWYLYDVSFLSYQRLCVLHNFGDLDLDLSAIPVMVLDNAGIIPSYLHIKFCDNTSTFNEVVMWYSAGDAHIYTDTHTDRQTNTSITITSLCEINYGHQLHIDGQKFVDASRCYFAM